MHMFTVSSCCCDKVTKYSKKRRKLGETIYLFFFYYHDCDVPFINAGPKSTSLLLFYNIASYS